jgi:hypothetical protein
MSVFSSSTGGASMKVRPLFGGLRVGKIKILKNPSNPGVLIYLTTHTQNFPLKFKKKKIRHEWVNIFIVFVL